MATILAAGSQPAISSVFTVTTRATLTANGMNRQSGLELQVSSGAEWLKVADLNYMSPVLLIESPGVYRVVRNACNSDVAAELELAAPMPTKDTQGGTRVYDFDNNSRTAVTGTSSAAISLPPLYDSREVMAHAKERTFVRFGVSSLSPATDGDKQLILEAGERFHLRIPVGVTHYRAIRETTDGAVTITAVVS